MRGLKESSVAGESPVTECIIGSKSQSSCLHADKETLHVSIQFEINLPSCVLCFLCAVNFSMLRSSLRLKVSLTF